MASITTRESKGSPLTYEEVDGNFTSLNFELEILETKTTVAKGETADRPTLTVDDVGRMYFDTTLAAAGMPIWWTGSDWVDATGTVA